MSEDGKPQRGASGGMQGGPSRGRSPITGPALPPPEAAQATEEEKPPCPQGTEAISQRINPAFFLQSVSPQPLTTTSLSPTITVISETPYSHPDTSGLSSNATTNAGIARRGGRSPSEARKLPERKPRSPRGMSDVGKSQGGASGGMQGGPRRGRSPITGPALPPPEAAQTTNKNRPPCPQGTKIPSQRTSPVSLPLPPAA